VVITENPETGLIGWKLNNKNFELELVQRLPDQTRGLLEARGFPEKIADDLAKSCMFQTIVRNTSGSTEDGAITVKLADWNIFYKNTTRKLKLKEAWDREWPGDKVSKSSRLAFKWGMFPNEQTFATGGDYNWGITSFNIPPGARFDLEVVWHSRGRVFKQRINGISCTKDVDRLK